MSGRWLPPGLLLLAACAYAQERPDVLAVVGDKRITAAEVEQKLGGSLLELRNREYNLKRQALDEILAQWLLEQEAKARGIAPAALEQAEIQSKAAPVTEAEKKAAYESVKARVQGRSEEEVMRMLEPQLRQERVRERRAAYVAELRRKSGARILLDPPRVKLDAAGGPVRGGKDAPVKIVEYSDFQCPYCARVNPTLLRLLSRYGDKIQIVYRDFPLSIHKEAGKAAEAGACAEEQGRFWEMHDKLFENQPRLAAPDLKRYAGELKLDAAAFGACLDSGKHAGRWRQGLQEGERYGVTGTPAFFINGRMLFGAQPYESFAQIIDEELERPAAGSR